ncbi:tetratricopeptide repeat protein [Paractinoplanes durhamensis]|uniref:Tetratricopeptide repeat protein n=1 Tax=Paractinoplanes durhamensis TaxID=113563 RepID=A0ABQ3Z4T2_9ACTN|nr:tetratricopeptide repeat protein [Actinoplanes durhamensis]GIE04839.1 hypothetical protein Adu01nite_61890 [Actinoplanes durhamensis]
MRSKDRIEWAVFSGDTSGLAEVERELDVAEADTALARGRLLHVRYQNDRAGGEDPAELPLFERALELYRALGDTRGEADALFWIGCLHQYIRRDDKTAVPFLAQAARSDDRSIRSHALRHLGIAAHTAGRLDEAREHLEESSRLRREDGELPGVAANMVGLAYIAAAQDRRADALAILGSAHGIAESEGAAVIVRQLAEARSTIEAQQ